MKMQEQFWSKLDVSQNERILRLATEATRVGVWEIGIGSQHVHRNLFHDMAFGYENLQGHWDVSQYLNHIHPDDLSRVLSDLGKLRTEKLIQDVEFRVIWPDKSIHWLKVSACFEGEQQVGTVIDITDKKQVEIALNEALFYRDEFLSIASHELKTPITTLKLQSQLFKRLIDKKDPTVYRPDKVDRLIDQTDKQVSRLSRLIDSMLDISRIRTGKLSINREQIDIAELVYLVAQKTNITINKMEPVFCTCDKVRIEQVLMNLISNAQAYGMGKPVTITLVQKSDLVSISIVDQGMGIEPQNLDNIFNRFKRAIPASEVSGIGLGLYISREIMKAHKGSIDVQSTLGKGSTFTIHLPIENGV